MGWGAVRSSGRGWRGRIAGLGAPGCRQSQGCRRLRLSSKGLQPFAPPPPPPPSSSPRLFLSRSCDTPSATLSLPSHLLSALCFNFLPVLGTQPPALAFGVGGPGTVSPVRTRAPLPAARAPLGTRRARASRTPPPPLPEPRWGSERPRLAGHGPPHRAWPAAATGAPGSVVGNIPHKRYCTCSSPPEQGEESYSVSPGKIYSPSRRFHLLYEVPQRDLPVQ